MNTARYHNPILTKEQALGIAKNWFKPGIKVRSVMGTVFTVSASPEFIFSHSGDYLYCESNIVYSFISGKWATIIGREELPPITKEQKEHLINLIKSI